MNKEQTSKQTNKQTEHASKEIDWTKKQIRHKDRRRKTRKV